MLNKELLLSSAESVGTVAVYMDVAEGFYEKDKFYLYKFKGNNWQVSPEDTIYAEFTIDDAHTTKVVSIPIGTVLMVDADIASPWFGDYEGFEYVNTGNVFALKLASKTAKVALSGYYP